MTDIYADSHVTIPSIQCMFSGKGVFITGATGFLGKVLLEKLVRSCPGISQILVLIRHNEKYTSSERLAKLLESSVFDRVKIECPDLIGKIRDIDGDVTCENLALCEEDLKVINSEVNYVFHCAASVRFKNEPKSTLTINLIGVKNLLKLCKNLPKLEALVHVSTAYSFCNQNVVEEKIYPEGLQADNLIEIIKWMNDGQLKELCKTISKSRPSLYQYSKAMSEIYLYENSGDLPVIIVRPAIITAAIKEPFPGWIDNYNGPSGFIALSSKGILKTLLVRPGVNADWVPVDLVANTLIVAAHHIATQRKYALQLQPLQSPTKIPVINCVCPPTNTIKWSEVVNICIPLLFKYPSLHVYRLPGGVVTACSVIHIICKYFYHYIPASILDIGLFLMWKEMRFVNTYRRIHRVMDFLQHYTMHEFYFQSGNMCQLSEAIAFEDKGVFPIDQNCLEWKKYLEDYVHGVRLFFLKENDRTLPIAQKKLLKLRYLFACGKMLPVGIVLIYLLRRMKKSTILSFLAI